MLRAFEGVRTIDGATSVNYENENAAEAQADPVQQ
jgi:hypothetical protein